MNYLIKCSNTDCKFCATDTVTSRLVCSDVPDLMHWENDSYGFVVRCKRFQSKFRKSRAARAVLDTVNRTTQNWMNRVKDLGGSLPS